MPSSRLKLALLGLITILGLVQASGTSGALYAYRPTRRIAGISVIDTPLVRAAEKFAKQHSSHAIYKHVMRSWLYGTLMLDANETPHRNVDPEVHAVATLLHDLGWDRTKNWPLISPNRRFEVDGAFAAREFIHAHKDGKHWDDRRTQLVWDSIALHTERSISFFKELDVQVVSKGIIMDFSGPAYDVSEDDYAVIGKAFPKDDLKNAVNQSIIWLCDTKPQTTIDTWMQPFGERHVEGYNIRGKQRVDLIFQNLSSKGQ
ncbi:hypothetical protein NW762_010633 [Fusarium torreyae]|uniref:HD domain-containing protein n=1 Tax=Fusarium torreyae TaxID=1237075 RepID=A0A9W8RUP1_9HYPO|nr:hypothetical protein NW762_010633 [Fusarium torreyae]